MVTIWTMGSGRLAFLVQRLVFKLLLWAPTRQISSESFHVPGFYYVQRCFSTGMCDQGLFMVLVDPQTQICRLTGSLTRLYASRIDML
jgi:hypothetical protein